MLQKVVCSAPGKIILCGEHAVVYGKEAIACSLDLRTSCVVEFINADKVIIIAENIGLEKEYLLSVLYHLHTITSHQDKKKSSNELLSEEQLGFILDGIEDKRHKLSLHVILTLFLSIATNMKTGIKIVLSSELPIGGGLGSSASFAVSLSASLLILYGFICCGKDQLNTEDCHLINTWANKAERIAHEFPSGIDSSISTFGQYLSFKENHIEHLFGLAEINLKVLIIDTKVQRSTKAIVRGVKAQGEKWSKLYNSLFQTMDIISATLKVNLIQLAHDHRDVSVEENIKYLIEVNQHLLESICVGHDKINQVVQLCRKYDVASKLTGAGCGGCVFAFIPSTCTEQTVDNLRKELTLSGFKVWSTVIGGKGVEAEMVT